MAGQGCGWQIESWFFLAITLFSFGGWVNSITLSRSMGDFGVRTIEKDITSVHPMFTIKIHHSQEML